MPESDPHLLDLFSRAFTDPGLARGEGRFLLRPGDMPWEVFEATLAHFVERTVAATPGAETRRRRRPALGLRRGPASRRHRRVAGAHRMNRRAPRYERGADSCRTITTLGYAMKNPMRSMFR